MGSDYRVRRGAQKLLSDRLALVLFLQAASLQCSRSPKMMAVLTKRTEVRRAPLAQGPTTLLSGEGQFRHTGAHQEQRPDVQREWRMSEEQELRGRHEIWGKATDLTVGKPLGTAW